MADHPTFAALYDRLSGVADRHGFAARRRRLLSHACGAALEIGGGTGRNLEHYPPLERLVVVEPDGAMRRLLRPRLAAAAFPVEVLGAPFEDTYFADASFDTVVSSLVLCTVPDLDRALAEIRRVLRPDGTFLFLEHVAVPGFVGSAQRLLNPAWRRLAAGCNIDRDIPEAVRRAGFLISDIDRFHQPLGTPLASHLVSGVARSRRTAGAVA